jgi:hypothetical protein
MGPDFLGGGPLPGQLEIEEFADRCGFDFSHSVWQAGCLPSGFYSSMMELHASALRPKTELIRYLCLKTKKTKKLCGLLGLS